MEDIHDCKGRLVCKAEPSSGFIEAAYKRQVTKTQLSIGENFIIERDGIRTVITRLSSNKLDVKSSEINP